MLTRKRRFDKDWFVIEILYFFSTKGSSISNENYLSYPSLSF